MKIILDISKFLIKSSCCNKSVGIGQPLVVPMHPEPAELFRPFIEISQLPQNLQNDIDIHEFTVTFNPRKVTVKIDKAEPGAANDYIHDWFTRTITRYIKVYLFKKVKTKYNILFVPEFTKAGLIHYHAIAYIENASDYYIAKLKTYCNREYGRCIGKKVYNINNYIKYISKDIGKTGPVHPISFIEP